MDEEYSIKEFPEKCWWCNVPAEACNGLQEHHIYRGKHRATSPTVWLCGSCHDRVTINHEADIFMREVYEARQINPYPF